MCVPIKRRNVLRHIHRKHICGAQCSQRARGAVFYHCCTGMGYTGGNCTARVIGSHLHNLRIIVCDQNKIKSTAVSMETGVDHLRRHPLRSSPCFLQHWPELRFALKALCFGTRSSTQLNSLCCTLCTGARTSSGGRPAETMVGAYCGSAKCEFLQIYG